VAAQDHTAGRFVDVCHAVALRMPDFLAPILSVLRSNVIEKGACNARPGEPVQTTKMPEGSTLV